MKNGLRGAFTAIVTPFREDGTINWGHLENLARFQAWCGVSGIVPAGTTGESPTLSWDEQLRVIQKVADTVGDQAFILAGTGSNSTLEALDHSVEAVRLGRVHGLLLVTCYYNKPVSSQLRKGYFQPVAEAVEKENPEVAIVPYDIPARTGCRLLPADLYLLAQACQNVCGIKAATGKLEDMAEIREVLGANFSILSGDDALTADMMRRAEIAGNGVVSVMSNIFPREVGSMAEAFAAGSWSEGLQVAENLAPVFNLVSVEGRGPNEKYPNPCAVKTMMRLLGIDSGIMRQPLLPVDQSAERRCLLALRRVWEKAPEYFDPIREYFGVDPEQQLFPHKGTGQPPRQPAEAVRPAE